MTQLHHRIKTFGAWTLRQPFPGIYLWRDPHGQYYLVDHTGTRPLGQAPTGPDATAHDRRHNPDLTLHAYPDPHPIAYEFTHSA